MKVVTDKPTKSRKKSGNSAKTLAQTVNLPKADFPFIRLVSTVRESWQKAGSQVSTEFVVTVFSPIPNFFYLGLMFYVEGNIRTGFGLIIVIYIYV